MNKDKLLNIENSEDNSEIEFYECPECGHKMSEEDVEYECPFCEKIDMGEGFYHCEECDTLFNFEECLWECEFCHNEGIIDEEYEDDDDEEDVIIYDNNEYCPSCGAVMYGPYCDECGESDENQGWIGENYG